MVEPAQKLIIFGGLPGTGKTTIARELARHIGATHLRIDSIEQAIQGCTPNSGPLNEVGYCVAYAIAEDNLRIGRSVVADSVNALRITRDAWLDVARRAKVSAFEIEVKCSDVDQHRQRVEHRKADVPGLILPAWEQVVSREYDTWEGQHLIIDTADRTVAQNVALILEALRPCELP
jgi:predicted kinase